MSKSPRPLRKVAAICGIVLLALLVALLLPPPSGAQTETFRDSIGRITGTASRDANGTVTYRDGSGRMRRHGHARRQRHAHVPRRIGTDHRHGHDRLERHHNVPRCQRSHHRHRFRATAMNPMRRPPDTD